MESYRFYRQIKANQLNVIRFEEASSSACTLTMIAHVAHVDYKDRKMKSKVIEAGIEENILVLIILVNAALLCFPCFQ